MTDADAQGEKVFRFDTLLDPDFSREPRPYYKRMRDAEPVLRTQSFLSPGAMVYLSRHEDVAQALRNPTCFGSEIPRAREQGRWLLPQHVDPPEHLLYRRLLDPLFSPKRMNQLEDRVTAKVNELIDAFIDRGSCDFAEEFAVPLPASMFLVLMGLPLDQTDTWLSLKERLIRGTPGGGVAAMSPTDPVKMAAQTEFKERFNDLIEQRRREPKDDVLSAVVHAEIAGEPLDEEHLIAVCRLLFVAGLDTVTDSLTCFFNFLANSPEHRLRLIQDPDIIPMAVEEMLRYETPAPWVPRFAREDAEIRGCPIEPGDAVVLLLGSADTDERAYERADEVDFDRQNIRHFAFGAGVHRCLGMHLARLELRVALREWHRRIPEYRIPAGVELEWAPVMRQVWHLPLEFESASS